MEDKIKIKPLTKAQIIISLDRLTRFKPTEEKYLRVFKDILVSNLISPVFKKNQLEKMDYEILTKYVEDIFDYSLQILNYPTRRAERPIPPSKGRAASHGSGMRSLNINEKLLKYEKSVFKFDENVEKLLSNKIDYAAALKLFDVGMAIPTYVSKNDLPLNLAWLKSLSQDADQFQNREKFGLKFPIEKVVIVEGITEEILLPKFAKILGYDFDKAGITLISAGGKNQVVKLFYKLSESLKLPIFVLLDSDAKENFAQIKPRLRNHDKVHVLESGEFEDILPITLIKRTLNQHPQIYSNVLLDDLRQGSKMTEILQEVLKQRGLEFKKAEFASMVADNVQTQKDISPEIECVISLLCQV